MDEHDNNAWWETMNDPARDINRREEQGSETPDFTRASSATSPEDRRGALLTAEHEGDGIKYVPKKNTSEPVTHKGRAAKLGQLFTSKKLRGKSSLIAVMLLIFGGGSFMTILATPGLAIVQMKEVYTKTFNDQLKAVSNREASLLRSKLKGVTSGGCGVAVMPCKFQTTSDAFIKKLESTDRIKVDVKEGSDLKSKMPFTDRKEITGFHFFDEKGKEVASTSDPRELTSLLMNNKDARAAMLEGYNPLYQTFKDKVASTYYKLKKITQSLKPTGNTDEERQKKVDTAVSNGESTDTKSLIHTKDKDGNDIYTDEQGNPVDKTAVDAAEQQGNRIENYMNDGGTKGVLNSALKGAGYLAAGVGTLDTACTVFNTIRYTNALAKTIKSDQAARFAMAMVLTPADAVKAGMADEGTVNYVLNNYTATKPASKVIDDSKLNDPTNAQKPTTIDDPTAGMNAFDSPMYKAAAYGDAVTPSLQDSRLMLGGGYTGIADAALSMVARVVNFGNPDLQQVSQKCKTYIQNWPVRVGALAVGLVAGAGSFGVLTGLGIGASLALSMTLPYYESQIADTLAGDAFTGLTGYDTGTAGGIGTAVIGGGIAQARGMAPVTSSEGIDYLNQNQQTYDAYVQNEQYIARNTPFDINNQYSFLGSIATSLTPTVQRSKSTMSAAMMGIASMIPSAFNSFFKTASAASTDGEGFKADYFEKCHDPGYQSLGIKAGEFCEPHYWMSQAELDMDAVVNAQWMVDNGEIAATSETGDPTDNGKDWNYAKFTQICVDGVQKYGWGEYQEDTGSNGSECIDKSKEALNMHYRVFTMDKSIQDSMDSDSASTTPLPGTTGGPTGTPAPVSSTGWAFPTVSTDSIVKGYQASDNNNHPGVDIAASSDSATKGQAVYAAYSGKVIVAGSSRDYCNWIVIAHDVDGKTFSTVYGNLTADGIAVTQGQSVKAGDPIGRLDVDTGDQSCVKKPYLYFELWQGSPLLNGYRIDPTPTLEAARKDKVVTNV
jgi:hypothetical protein